jgi:hypothetical protein
VVQRLRQRLRQAGPETLSIVRGDSHFASPEVRPWLEAPAHLRSVTGVTSNRVVPQLAHAVVEQAKRASARDGAKGTRFHSTRSQAGPGSRPRRVVIQGEVSEPGVTTRFVVTALEPTGAQGLSRPLYGARGPADNARKAHKRSLQSDRPSWHRFAAHPCRLCLPSAASVLRDTLRREVCKGTPGARATMETIQLRWRKLGARVQA